MEMKDALSHIVRSYTGIEELRKAYVKVGLNSDPLFESAEHLIDALYYMIGEDKKGLDDFKESVAYVTMKAPFLKEERRVSMLMAEYLKNHPAQPRPNVMSSDGMKELYKDSGGYISPEGDWK